MACLFEKFVGCCVSFQLLLEVSFMCMYVLTSFQDVFGHVDFARERKCVF